MFSPKAFLCVYVLPGNSEERNERQLANSVNGGAVDRWLVHWTVECVALLQESSVAFKLVRHPQNNCQGFWKHTHLDTQTHNKLNCTSRPRKQHAIKLPRSQMTTLRLN